MPLEVSFLQRLDWELGKVCTGRLVQRDMGLQWWYTGIGLDAWLSVEFCMEGIYPHALLAACESGLIQLKHSKNRTMTRLLDYYKQVPANKCPSKVAILAVRSSS